MSSSEIKGLEALTRYAAQAVRLPAIAAAASLAELEAENKRIRTEVIEAQATLSRIALKLMLEAADAEVIAKGGRTPMSSDLIERLEGVTGLTRRAIDKEAADALRKKDACIAELEQQWANWESLAKHHEKKAAEWKAKYEEAEAELRAAGVGGRTP